jgi:para-nitrobenzyl esterase
MRNGPRFRHWFALSVGVMLCLGSVHAAEPIVTTQKGQLRGAQLRKPNVYVFKGVHYGRSTAGSNRFLPSRRVGKWSGVKDALEFGPMCPQVVEPGRGSTSQKRSSVSEDCLVLNVWTPSIGTDEKRRPVMVWLHGPGFDAGSGSEPEYDGARLAKRGDVVVVTLNHRLGAFGHLHLVGFGGKPYASSGNIGLQDIQLALEWIRDNIAVFGGDPGNVTLFGGAGGGSKVSTLLGVPSAQGLFHRAIIQGDVRTRAMPAAQASNNALAVMDKLQARTIEELQAVPMDRLLAAVSTAGTVPEFGPVHDGTFLPFDMFEPVAAVSAHGIPILVGSNTDGDASLARFIEAAVKVAPLYVYRFAYEAPTLNGARGREIAFVFGNASASRSSGKGAKAVEDAMSEAWIAFARTGNPNHRGLPHWPTYSTKARATMVFDVQSKVANDPAAPEKQASQ